MKLKLIDTSRNIPKVTQKTSSTTNAENASGYTLASIFSGKTLVDLTVYRQLLSTKTMSTVACRLTKSQK